MNPENILLPIDIRRCLGDVFPLADRLAARPGAHLTLSKKLASPKRQTDAFMRRLIVGAFILWLSLLASAFLNAPR